MSNIEAKPGKAVITVPITEHFVLHETGMEIKGNPSFDKCINVDALLKFFMKASPYARADLLVYLKTHYGEMYAQLLDSTDYSDSYINKMEIACERIPMSRRRASLSLAHHYEVAYLEPAEQDRWLERAEYDNMNRNHLRNAIRKERRENKEQAHTHVWQTWRKCIECGEKEEIA